MKQKVVLATWDVHGEWRCVVDGDADKSAIGNSEQEAIDLLLAKFPDLEVVRIDSDILRKPAIYPRRRLVERLTSALIRIRTAIRKRL